MTVSPSGPPNLAPILAGNRITPGAQGRRRRRLHQGWREPAGWRSLAAAGDPRGRPGPAARTDPGGGRDAWAGLGSGASIPSLDRRRNVDGGRLDVDFQTSETPSSNTFQRPGSVQGWRPEPPGRRPAHKSTTRPAKGIAHKSHSDIPGRRQPVPRVVGKPRSGCGGGKRTLLSKATRGSLFPTHYARRYTVRRRKFDAGPATPRPSAPGNRVTRKRCR